MCPLCPLHVPFLSPSCPLPVPSSMSRRLPHGAHMDTAWKAQAGLGAQGGSGHTEASVCPTAPCILGTSCLLERRPVHRRALLTVIRNLDTSAEGILNPVCSGKTKSTVIKSVSPVKRRKKKLKSEPFISVVIRSGKTQAGSRSISVNCEFHKNLGACLQKHGQETLTLLLSHEVTSNGTDHSPVFGANRRLREGFTQGNI